MEVKGGFDGFVIAYDSDADVNLNSAMNMIEAFWDYAVRVTFRDGEELDVAIVDLHYSSKRDGIDIVFRLLDDELEPTDQIEQRPFEDLVRVTVF